MLAVGGHEELPPLGLREAFDKLSHVRVAEMVLGSSEQQVERLGTSAPAAQASWSWTKHCLPLPRTLGSWSSKMTRSVPRFVFELVHAERVVGSALR